MSLEKLSERLEDPLLTKPASTQAIKLKAVLMIYKAIADTIQELGETSETSLYLAVSSHGMGLEHLHRILQGLVDMGMIRWSNHFITWIGPKLEKGPSA